MTDSTDSTRPGSAVEKAGRKSRRGHNSAPTTMASYDDISVDLAEALRGIVNRHELRSGALPKSIVTVAADAGEGVTTVSQALATLIAQETGRFVCWVDCSWLGSETDRAQPGQAGLVEILADNTRISSAFRTSPDLPQLVSLSPGPVPEADRNKIVRSPEFERLLDILSEEFDHVIFDLPPVLSHANALALVRLADAWLLVVRHRSTSLPRVRRVVDAMEPTPNLGVLLNRYRSSIPGGIARLMGN